MTAVLLYMYAIVTVAIVTVHHSSTRPNALPLLRLYHHLLVKLAHSLCYSLALWSSSWYQSSYLHTAGRMITGNHNLTMNTPAWTVWCIYVSV